MSLIRSLPVPLLAVGVLLVIALAAAGYAVVRWRTGVLVHWPYLVGGVLIVLGSVLIGVWASRPPFLTAPTAPASGRLSDIEEYLEHVVAAGDPPSVSVVVVKDGAVVYNRAFGSIDERGSVPASSGTVYRWWSITKLFTAVAIAQLDEAGRLDLDDPVVDHLPFFEVSGPFAADPITVRQLLTHTSGLPDAGTEILGWVHGTDAAPVDQTELTQWLLHRYSKLESEPGAVGRYTNIGYQVLAAVIESASGEDYDDYIRGHILEPLGMTRSGFVERPGQVVAVPSHPIDVMTVPAALALDLDDVVAGHSRGRLWFAPVYPDQQGPSGLLGTAGDLARFAAAMLDDGRLEGASILSPGSAAAMAERAAEATHSPAPTAGHGFGLGWFHRIDDRGRLPRAGLRRGTRRRAGRRRLEP